jgi:hypothetical protein
MARGTVRDGAGDGFSPTAAERLVHLSLGMQMGSRGGAPDPVLNRQRPWNS